MNINENNIQLNNQLDLVAEFYLREMTRREYPECIEEGNDYYDTLLDTDK